MIVPPLKSSILGPIERLLSQFNMGYRFNSIELMSRFEPTSIQSSESLYHPSKAHYSKLRLLNPIDLKGAVVLFADKGFVVSWWKFPPKPNKSFHSSRNLRYREKCQHKLFGTKRDQLETRIRAIEHFCRAEIKISGSRDDASWTGLTKTLQSLCCWQILSSVSKFQ